MMGPSSYSWAQGVVAAEDPPSHLVALRPEEMIYFNSDHFHGIFDTMAYHIEFGRHGNDSTLAMPNRPLAPVPSLLAQQLPGEVLKQRVAEALEKPDYKYNT